MSLPPLMIAIDGSPGTETSSLGIELAALLRNHCTVTLLHLRDICPGNAPSINIEGYVSNVLIPVSQGEHATCNSWHHPKRHQNEDPGVVLPADIVIIEGVGSAPPEARLLLSAVIWAEAQDEASRASALACCSGGKLLSGEWAVPEDARLAEDDATSVAEIRVRDSGNGSASADILRLLPHIPDLRTARLPKLGTHSDVKLRAERLAVRPDAADLFEALYGSAANAVWLDSSNASSPHPSDQAADSERSRFSILADDGGMFGQTLTHRSGENRITAGCATAKVRDQLFRWLHKTWGYRAVRAPNDYPCDFTLGWLGCLGYELKRETGGTDVHGRTPDAALIFAGRAVVLDHTEGTAWLLTLDSPDADSWLSSARSAVEAASPAARDEENMQTGGGNAHALPMEVTFSSRDTELAYKHKITAAQQEIREGNSYEVCLTTTLSASVKTTVAAIWQTYLALRRRNSAPFSSYCRFGGLTVASTSPERFLKITSDGVMRAEPIKGTRRRAAEPSEDARLRQELATSAKDRAENVMIVDLLRNDLSQFARPGSVTVRRLCEIESYATVHQMVSTIEAQLLPGSSRAAAVGACFPPGSMTGAPKISTMAILDQLEGVPRGLYSGVIGYFSLNAATDLAVTIRTLVIVSESESDSGSDPSAARPGSAMTTEMTLGIGGAITADSALDEEYEEIRVKAIGVLSTLGTGFPDC